jgi:hypothetical protein
LSAKRGEWPAARIHTRERRNVRGKVGRDFASSGRPCPKCPTSRLQTIGGELSRTSHKLSAEPLLSRWNESRTNRARIADSGPVGIRSRQYVVALAVLTTKSCKRPVNGCKDDGQSITGSAGSPKFAVSELGRRPSNHCVFAVALLGCGVDMNCVACRTPSPIGVGTVTRKGIITRVPAMGASQSSISRSCMRYLIA